MKISPKAMKVLYYFFTILLSVFLFADGVAGVLQLEMGVKSMVMLEYPLYLLIIVGWAKIFASLAIIQSKCTTLKEWAYAGYAIDCIGASLSWYFVSGSMLHMVLPIIFMAFASVSYVLWKVRG